MKSGITDLLIPVKLKFFAKTADELNKFLLLYQTDNPMVPFIAQSLEEIIRQFASTFILSEKLKAATSLVSLSKIDFKDRTCHKRAADVSLSIPIKVQLSDLKKRGKISDIQILKFKSYVVSFLSSLYAHLVAKSPIKYPLTRAAHYFIPHLLVEVKKTSENRFTNFLEILFKSEHTSGKIVEDAKWEFTKVLQDIVAVHKEEFLTFDIKDQRFDAFYFSYFEGRPSLSNLAEVLKMILTLSHGQASIERVFIINKSLLVENLHKESLTAQHIVYDHMKVNDLEAHETYIAPQCEIVKAEV